MLRMWVSMNTNSLNKGDVTMANYFRPDFVGFDRLFTLLDQAAPKRSISNTAFPAYNVVRSGDNEYRVDLALAGYVEEELDVSAEPGILTVESNRDVTDADDEGGIILHKGIAERNFRRQFTLMDNIEVTGANFVNGILSVYLVNVVPEKEQRRKVVIGSGDARGVFNKAKELLTE